MSAVAERKPDYTYWQNALAGMFGPVHDGDPQPGFYRKRTGKAAGYVPVAIWDQEGALVALVDGREADAAEIWTYVCQYPILEEWYRAKMAGQPWPDEDKSVTASLAPPPAGHNNPPTDEAEILKGQIEAASAGVGQYAQIKDDETAAKAQSLRSRLLDLSGSADKKRETLKKPHLEAGKEIDAKFQPLVKAAKAAADLIRDALGAHETRKANAAAKAEREASALRLAAVEAARLEALNASPHTGPKAVMPVAPPSQPVAPEPTPAPAATIRGAYGRAASVKLVKVAKVIDQDAAYTGLRTYPEMVALIATLAQRAATAGIPIPGVEVTEERTVS